MWAAVLGSPIHHSLSPVLHRAAYQALGLLDWSYGARECDEDGLAGLLTSARADPAFGGYSLTMPLKVPALTLVDELEPLAERVAAVNTVVPVGSGRLAGYNTDVPGMVAALQAAGITEVRYPVVLGGGGSSQAAVAALAVLGAERVSALLRRPERAGRLVQVAEAVGVALSVRPWPAHLREVGPSELVVSTVPAGATDGLAEAGWPGLTPLFDIVYAPWPTPLAHAAGSAGAVVVGGLELLVHQAVGQVKLMTGRDVDAAVLVDAGRRALAARTG